MLSIDLSGRVAIVTGNARGIGAATVEALRAAGAYVVGIDTLEAAAPAPDVQIVGDVADADSRAAVLEQIGDRLDGAVLVNNAGIVRLQRLSDTTEAEALRMLEVNVLSALAFTNEFARVVRTGSVVNVASINALTAERATGFYGVTKAAVANLTRAAALEYAGRLRVNAVSPGAVRTPMVTDAWAGSDDPETAEERTTRLYPVGRIGEPADVAHVIAFLASDLAGFVNGANWLVDGGLLAANAEWALERI